MYLLDTNTYQFVLKDQYGVGDRLREKPFADVFLSSVVVEERLEKGWRRELEHIQTRKSNSRREDVNAAAMDDLRFLSSFNIKPYSDAAEDKFREIKKKKVRVGEYDARIAAHTLVLDMTVVTDNVSDFEAIRDQFPDLKIENWAVRPGSAR